MNIHLKDIFYSKQKVKSKLLLLVYRYEKINRTQDINIYLKLQLILFDIITIKKLLSKISLIIKL